MNILISCDALEAQLKSAEEVRGRLVASVLAQPAPVPQTQVSEVEELSQVGVGG